MRSRFRKLRKKPGFVLAMACLLSCIAVAQQNQQSATVRTSQTPGVDFSKYHTYRWVDLKQRQNMDPIVDSQIKQSIDSQLAARGLTKTGDTADLSIDYQTAMSKGEKWESYEDWTDQSPMRQGIGEPQKVIIEVGTLVIDMYDTAAKKLVWTARANNTLDPTSSQKERQKRLDKATKELLKDFPRK
jgi:hypothetical protein